MSSARHHAEWLSLVEVSGPFLSMPVLLRVFPQGLDAHDPDGFKVLRRAYEEWDEDRQGRRPDTALHRQWVRFVLDAVLELPAEVLAEGQALPPGLETRVAEHAETLRPDLAVVNPPGGADAGKPRLLIQVLPASQDLDKPLQGAHWKASPGSRMVELLRGTDVRLGLVTNGERWMLVHAPRGETSSFISWYAPLWLDEPLTLRAFRSLLGVHRFFAVGDAGTLEALFTESAENQQEVTDQLGFQVRRAVEVLVQAIDRADKDRQRTLLEGVSEKQLYEAAVTVMMRLVFLFSAEERGLLLLGDALYDQHYAVSTLRAQLRETADQHTEDVLERRHDAWSRLLATFRAVFGGVAHEAMRLPAYGGTLFNPDRFPFLEGRAPGTSWREIAAHPLPIHNRTVLHLLEALQMLQVKVPGGGPTEARRLSFRALDIEQIGHVYEGLLDHTAVRATDPVVGLAGAKNQEPEIALSTLEEARACGEDRLLKLLKEQTGRQEPTLRRLLTSPSLVDEQRLLIACDNDRTLFDCVRPFAGLTRTDTSDYPAVITAGSVYVTQGSDRRTTGTHYTPRSLTEPIVQHALEPLVYEGPAEGWPQKEWRLRSARELLALKVCDFAMGSGAFLVQACRYLSERLVEAWEDVEREAFEGHADSPLVITPEGDLSTGAPGGRPIPRDADERLAIARRLVVDRCLYGVDKNPMAVEMAKLSLWLITLQKDRPFTFLDHALKCGDSLVGVDMEQLRTWSLDRKGANLLAGWVEKDLRDAVILRKELEALEEFRVDDVVRKERLHQEAEKVLERVQLAGDLIVAPEFMAGSAREQQAERERLQGRFVAFRQHPESLEDVRVRAAELLGELRPFHWPLEFPEVFTDESRGGFAAIVGNPPFKGGRGISGIAGAGYRDYLVGRLASGQRGSADLCAYFFLRASQLLSRGGTLALLATNSIAQGETKAVGLDQMTRRGITLYRAVRSRKWPGSASLEVSHIWGRKGPWCGPFILDDCPVTKIAASLEASVESAGEPKRLRANARKAFQGVIVLGMGFVVSPDEAQRLIAKDNRNRDVLFPYLNGEDLNSRPDQSPSRWVINFGEMSEKDAATYTECYAIVRESVYAERALKDRAKYPRMVDEWWKFWCARPELRQSVGQLPEVLVTTRVSAFHFIHPVAASMVFSDRLVVFATDDAACAALLGSTIHEVWAHRPGTSTHETRPTYSPETAFEPFAQPPLTSQLRSAGQAYLSHRGALSTERKAGLRTIYARFHDGRETAEDIARLRELHVEMDQAVAAAYGWTDLGLGHGFHETKQGVRFTISEAARREVLGRLLALNHERYAEEVAQGLHDKGGKGKRGKAGQAALALE